MNNEIARYSEETFESIKHVNEYGNEFWYARSAAISSSSPSGKS